VRSRHPGFLEAVVADARIAAVGLGDRRRFPSRVEALLLAVRLSLITDAFLALVLPGQGRLQGAAHPCDPRFFHRLAVMIGQVAIGDPVVVQPGVYVPHGQVVVDGIVEVGSEVARLPFVTIGLRARSAEARPSSAAPPSARAPRSSARYASVPALAWAPTRS
jgi:hypothetical protein